MKKQDLKVGQSYYSTMTRKAGNTTLNTVRVYETIITRIEGDKVYGSWNTNPEHWLSDSEIKGLRKDKPLLVSVWRGIAWRKATREEIKEFKATGKVEGMIVG